MIATAHELAIEIGAMPIVVRTHSAEFVRLIENRYGGFVNPDTRNPAFELEIDLAEQNGESLGHASRGPGFGKPEKPGLRTVDYDQDLTVHRKAGLWVLERGDFHAELDPQRRCGWVRQTANPYSIDGVLRILHSLLLAREGGFLIHAASAVRDGRAYIFAGVSGAGKTTISRLAPLDVKLLTDEISYVRPVRSRDPGVENPPSPGDQALNVSPAFWAYGTPFAGELARIGENLRAPLAALYLLVKGPENRFETITESEAARAMLRHILFFAQDQELVGLVFESVLDFVSRVPVRRLVFARDPRVWELIGE